VSRSSLRQFLVRVAIASVLAVATTAAGVVAGNTVFEEKFDSSPRIDVRRVLEPEEDGDPANFLVVGSDSRSFVDDPGERDAFGDPDEVGGQRSDVLMVVHVEPDTRTGFVVSFPRDLWVQIPGHGSSRINSAYGIGGPELVIETISRNFGIPIHHYLEVDFEGFRRIVDTIGGVHLQFHTPARDTVSGLSVTEPGCRELDGDEALAYVRSRHFEWFDAEDGEWVRDGRSDFSRIERQQYFIRSLADEAIDGGARSVLTALDLLDAVFDNLARDEELDLDDLKGLINAFRDLDPASIEMTTLPTDAAERGGADVLVVRTADAEPILARLRTFGPPDVELPELVLPGDVRIRVLNGSGVRGRAAEVLDALVAHGFVAAEEPADADRDDYPLTHVRYAPGLVNEGLVVGAYVATADVAQAREPLPENVDVEVVVGRDWDSLVSIVKQPPSSTTSAADHTSTSARGTATTTTTRPPSPSQTAVVPVDPDTGGPLVGCP
jgi:LCP family protein required for cell wall assembly